MSTNFAFKLVGPTCANNLAICGSRNEELGNGMMGMMGMQGIRVGMRDGGRNVENTGNVWNRVGMWRIGGGNAGNRGGNAENTGNVWNRVGMWGIGAGSAGNRGGNAEYRGGNAWNQGGNVGNMGWDGGEE